MIANYIRTLLFLQTDTHPGSQTMTDVEKGAPIPRIEDLTPGSQVNGILSGYHVTMISAKYSNIVELTY
jgi:hypothetical protein